MTFTVFFYFTLSTTTAKFEFFSDFLPQKIYVFMKQNLTITVFLPVPFRFTCNVSTPWKLPGDYIKQ